MKSFKNYIKEVQGVGPGAGDARGQSSDTDTGMSAGDVTNPETLRRLNAYLGSLVIWNIYYQNTHLIV